MNDRISQVLSFGVSGVDGFPVQVEVFSAGGLPGMDIIGLPDASVRESRERVNAAIINSGKDMPPKRTTVNLAPADIRKEGPSFDLPIAIGLLIANHKIRLRSGLDLSRIVIFGELSLDGRVQPVHGALAIVISASKMGIRDILLPAGNAMEVACVQGMNIYPVSTLAEAIGHLEGNRQISPQQQVSYEELLKNRSIEINLSQVKGQQGARRALEVAAAGGHNLLMIGAPGSGKTMLARCLPGILPPLSFQESLETTRIFSIAGKLEPGAGLMVERPFCAPHHSASVASLVGGGSGASPGEVSLAHNGVLFLDELPEFSRTALEALRQPLEDGMVTITRVRQKKKYQSSFMLVASMNPCPCGYYGSSQRECRCSPQQIRHYLDQVSGPLLDRIDMQIEVDSVPVSEIRNEKPAESSEAVGARVLQARLLQLDRYAGTGFHCNAQLDNAGIQKYCGLSDAAENLLHAAVKRMKLSMRAYHRVIKVARTVADLRESETIGPEDVAEAIQFRELDGKYWG